MKQIITVKSQTVFDLAVQEYGNAEAAFEILKNNPGLVGMNDFPAGYNLEEGVDFDIAHAIKEGVTVNIDTDSDYYKSVIVKQLNKIVS